MADVPVPHGEALESLEGAIVGRFAVRERLGEGGMGEVYRAEDTKLRRSVALKRMAPHLRSDPQYRNLFLKEAERVSRFTDPHIAALYDILEQGEDVFLVMELVQGRSLRQRLREPMSLEEFLGIATQCVQGLAAAHSRGIVHCDIKPENIMITTSGTVKILDFGVARRVSQSALSTAATTGMSGTAGYMAPEVVLERVAGPTADLFSLGVVFYEALAGFHPFLRGTFFETCESVLHDDPVPLDQVGETPPELAAIVQRMIAKNVDERYHQSAELIEHLKLAPHETIMLSTGSARPPAGPASAASKRARTRRTLRRQPRSFFRSRWLAAGCAMLVVVIALLAVTGAPGKVRRWVNRMMGVKPQQLAVLPFTSTEGDASAQAFSAGLTEAISARLGGGADESIQVVPTGELRSQKVDSVDKARQQFGVDLVLTGSLRESGNLVRVSYILEDARTRRQLRGDTVTVTAGDPFALEDQVMASLLRSLRLEPQRGSAYGTSEGSAYVYYLRGRGYLQDYTRQENLEAAVAAFKSALERDPNYALAYAGLGQTYWHRFQELRDPSQVNNATLACERALAIDPKLSQAHICLGTAYTNTGRYDDAIQQFRQAVASESTNDDAVRGLGVAFEKAKRFAEAENTFRAAIRLRPHYWANYNLLGAFYWRRGRYDEAAKVFQQVIQIAPDNYRGYNNLAGVHIMQGKYAEAIPLLERCVAIRPNPSGFANLGSAYFFLRRFDEAVRVFSRAVQLNAKDFELRGNLADAQYWAPSQRRAAMESYRQAIQLAQPRLQVNAKDTNVLLSVAQYHGMIGEKQPALDYLARAQAVDPKARDLPRNAAIIYAQFGDRAQTMDQLEKFFAGGGSPAYVRSWPNFDSLNSDPRYQQLMKSAEAVQVH
ncbi:MAG: protein kinase [Acidobacteriia bacterium]|nr:protein kinase [Terriglobia bacterium]